MITQLYMKKGRETKTINNKKVLLLDNNYLTARLLQALLNYGANVFVPADDYNNVMGAIPLLPALIAFQSSGADLPTGVTAPMPVITTLLVFLIGQDSFFKRVQKKRSNS